MKSLLARTQAARRPGFDWAVERLLHGRRPHRARRLERQERRVQGAAAAIVLVAAAGLVALVPSDRDFSPGIAVALVVGYALASRIRLYVGAGYTMPTQLVLVPMLFWLPATSVPPMVVCALLAAALVDVARRRAHPERALTAITDAWYAIGPSLVILAAGEPSASDVAWPVVALALVAQCLFDLLGSTAREWAGRGIPPALQLRVILSVYLIDACLTPVGVLAATRDPLHGSAIVTVVPLLGVMAAFALDRRARIDELTRRLDELQEERRRVDASIRRVGEASGAGLDRPALLDLGLRTAMEALGAAVGRARAAGSAADAGTHGAGGDMERAVDDAARAACESGRRATTEAARSVAIAQPLATEATESTADGDVIVVGRNGRPFSAEEQALFGYLAGQLSVAMENVALHERVRREARIDELTGLANHRHFQETLAAERERMRRFRRPLGLVMVDIDHFKAVNDTYGHQQGDEVLRRVAAAMRDVTRAVDTPARYGGEELAVVLPDTGLDGAHAAGEQIRKAVEAVRVPRPDGPPLDVTVSVGVAAADPQAADPASLIAAADAALYEAKRGGRNRTVRAGGTAAARFARDTEPRDV